MTRDPAAAYPGRSAPDILKARGVRRLVYFHTDHFEPWRNVPGRPADLASAIGDVEAYLRESEKRDFARAATLFYKANINFAVNGRRWLWRADPSDLLGFVPPDPEADEMSARVLGALSEAGRELQVHIHHENITWNDSIRDAGSRAHLDTPEHRRFDDARFELLLRLNLDLLRRQAGFDPTRWFFIHGHWALNASDPHECTIVREIEILRRNGCLGDFTQPAGRVHVDSRIDEPYLARPVAKAKGYDRPEADPVPAAGAGEVAADRFLIWASAIGHYWASIDHSSAFVRKRMSAPERFARAHAAGGFVHDGVLYVKTHAHMMAPVYWQAAGGVGPFPHADAGIVAELGGLFDAASAAGVEVEFAGVSAAFHRLLGAAPVDHALTVPSGHAMAAIGCDVAFRSAAGDVDAPPLGVFPERAMVPRRTKAGKKTAAVWPEVRALPWRTRLWRWVRAQFPFLGRSR
ncbi:hypothetical protein [Sphingomonas sp. ID0503]|uniref:hypothetical protein n=1 Tax=Sphingomonas sp. ID0503 TaxID=3399691 RepID=UPI003AFB66D4